MIDSTRARPLVGARVVAVGVDARATTSGAASTDSAGRYHIGSLAPGRYAVGFESPLLDSLEINLSPRTVVVAPGQTATIDLALPPAAKLRGALCPGVTLPPQTGVIFGLVVDADSENRLADVVVAMSWQERDVDRVTLRPVNRERTASATTDAGGWYRLCGVPTDTWLSLQLQHMGRTGPVIRALVGDTLGIAVRHLSFSASTARPASDSAASASASVTDSVAALALSGTAMLSGIVRGTGDLPLASADVSVRGTRGAVKADTLGRYSLSGLPAGTQMLEVRRIGYAAVELPVELRSGVMLSRDVRLQRIVNLDSIRVVASRYRYREFNELRQRSMFGHFYGPEEMAAERTADLSDVVGRLPGVAVVGSGSRARAVVNRGPNKGCVIPIILNGVPGGGLSINDFPAPAVGAMVVYQAGEIGPTEVDWRCGAIMIWSRR